MVCPDCNNSGVENKDTQDECETMFIVVYVNHSLTNTKHPKSEHSTFRTLYIFQMVISPKNRWTIQIRDILDRITDIFSSFQ